MFGDRQKQSTLLLVSGYSTCNPPTPATVIIEAQTMLTLHQWAARRNSIFIFVDCRHTELQHNELLVEFDIIHLHCKWERRPPVKGGRGLSVQALIEPAGYNMILSIFPLYGPWVLTREYDPGPLAVPPYRAIASPVPSSVCSLHPIRIYT